MSRPRIPAEIAREVLVEAGHRCAVCGTPFPLERAHIVPWRRTRDHSPENLICLCANCHGMADSGLLGERDLKEYKARPWVRRQLSSSRAKPEFAPIKLVIRKEMRDFDSYQEQMLRYALAKFLEVNPEDVEIFSMEEGSVRIFLGLPPAAAERIERAFREDRERLQRSLPAFPIEEVEAALAGEIPLPPLPEGPGTNALLGLVRETIAALPPEYKRFLELDMVEALPPAEIQARLGLRSEDFLQFKAKAFEALRTRLLARFHS